MAITVTVSQYAPDLDLPVKTTIVRHRDGSIINFRAQLDSCADFRANFATVDVDFGEAGVSTAKFERKGFGTNRHWREVA